MAKKYTHTFDIKAKGDGSFFLSGDFDLGVEGKQKSLKKFSDPLDFDFLQDALELIKKAEVLYEKYDGLKKIEIKEKNG